MSVTALLLINTIILTLLFVISLIIRGKLRLIHKLYILLTVMMLVWLLSVLGMELISPGQQGLLMILDAMTCAAGACVGVTLLLIAQTFIKNFSKLPRPYYLLFLFPLFSALTVFSNPWHHLYYREFSIQVAEISFGPLFYFIAAVNYANLAISVIIILRYGILSAHHIHLRQCLLLAAGTLAPMIVNVLATLNIFDLTIAATPISLLVTVACHGIAIYYFNFFSIKPAALQNVLDNISDCFVILAADTFVINCNQPFEKTFGALYGIKANLYLNELAEKLEPERRGPVDELLDAVENCLSSHNDVTFEQLIAEGPHNLHFSVELTPLFLRGEIAGAVALYRDITRLKEDMRREQNILSRAMEHERLASLGQMIGGIAHNLKTPIMSISGSVNALGHLTDEYSQSVDDPEVMLADHLEIADDMRKWLAKIQECCTYMSDIISTVKGQAANMSAVSESEFTMQEVLDRVLLLIQHRLMKNNCLLELENTLPEDMRLQGDINNLVQVVNNLLDNAVDAMEPKGGGKINLSACLHESEMVIRVADQGPGMEPAIRERLFHEMVTTKGAMGTGLGLYVSNSLIHGRYGGRMWAEDNPGGGSIIFIAIPLENNVA